MCRCRVINLEESGILYLSLSHKYYNSSNGYFKIVPDSSDEFINNQLRQFQPDTEKIRNRLLIHAI